MKRREPHIGTTTVVALCLIAGGWFPCGPDRLRAQAPSIAPKDQVNPPTPAPAPPLVVVAGAEFAPPVLTATQVSSLQSAIESRPAVAVASIIGKVNARGKIKAAYTPFVMRSLRDGLQTRTVQGLPPIPAVNPSPTASLKVADALDTMTEDQVRAIWKARLGSLTGTTMPRNLKEQVLRQHERSKQVLRADRPPPLTIATPTVVFQGQKRFDWRDPGHIVPNSGIVTAVQDQTTPVSCGCCWAFATIGALEAAYAKNNLQLVGASEQYLLNCAGTVLNDPSNPMPWSCGGGWFAFDMLSLKAGMVPNPGAPRRTALRFSGEQAACQNAPARPYQVANWDYLSITGDANAIPTDTELKQALCTFGPLACAIFVPEENGSAIEEWVTYQGGVIQDVPNGPGVAVTHAVVLVGWDDNQGGGAWIVKNSWSSGWGMGGFFYVKYGFNNIGTGACWVLPAPKGG